MNIKIELISESDLADESFNIVIDGLKPREIYNIGGFNEEKNINVLNVPEFFKQLKEKVDNYYTEKVDG